MARLTLSIVLAFALIGCGGLAQLQAEQKAKMCAQLGMSESECGELRTGSWSSALSSEFFVLLAILIVALAALAFGFFGNATSISVTLLRFLVAIASVIFFAVGVFMVVWGHGMAHFNSPPRWGLLGALLIGMCLLFPFVAGFFSVLITKRQLLLRIVARSFIAYFFLLVILLIPRGVGGIILSSIYGSFFALWWCYYRHSLRLHGDPDRKMVVL